VTFVDFGGLLGFAAGFAGLDFAFVVTFATRAT